MARRVWGSMIDHDPGIDEVVFCESLKAMPDVPHPLETLREKAWIGDAVLELYVRSWVLKHHGAMDAEMKTRFTCNQFLNCVGNPTKVEADIGVIYQKDGLEAAFSWIREHLEPLFVKQEARRAPRRH